MINQAAVVYPLAAIDADAVVSLDEIKAWARLDDTEDSLLDSMRAKAIDYVERTSGVALAPRLFRQTDKQFCARMRLYRSPVVSISSVKYYDLDGADVSLDPTDWDLGGEHIFAPAGTRWPYASGNPGSVRIEFVAGLDNAQVEAPGLIAAVVVAASEFYRNREAPDFTPVIACENPHRVMFV